jgi:mRNA-degrading endonuclease RelE of RelBE toxin-antitoxin system
MDKIQKVLKKLSPKERKAVDEILEKLLSDNWSGLDIARLQGASDIYRVRVRVGSIRIIYYHKGTRMNILAIKRRSEKTYRNF